MNVTIVQYNPPASLQLFHATKSLFPRNKPVTVPRTWLQGKYFGDSDAVAEAHRSGRLVQYAASR